MQCSKCLIFVSRHQQWTLCPLSTCLWTALMTEQGKETRGSRYTRERPPSSDITGKKSKQVDTCKYTVTRWREDPSLFKRGEGKDLPWREAWAFCIMNSMHVYINFLRTVREGGYFLELIKEAWLDFQFQTTRGAFQSTADRKWIPYMHWTRQMLLNLTLTWKENIFIFVSPPPHDH